MNLETPNTTISLALTDIGYLAEQICRNIREAMLVLAGEPEVQKFSKLPKYIRDTYPHWTLKHILALKRRKAVMPKRIHVGVERIHGTNKLKITPGLLRNAEDLSYFLCMCSMFLAFISPTSRWSFTFSAQNFSSMANTGGQFSICATSYSYSVASQGRGIRGSVAYTPTERNLLEKNLRACYGAMPWPWL